MKQLIYRSQPFGFDNSMLAGILMQARRNNPRNGITGALICRQDMYIQLIEGPNDAIDALFARISGDDRHTNVQVMLSEEVVERMFPDWAMLDDAFPSMTWSPEEIAGGALEDATTAARREVFQHVANRAGERATGSD